MGTLFSASGRSAQIRHRAMVETTIRRDQGFRVVIRPNRSLSWAQMKRVYAGLAALCMFVAVGFTLLGYWMVLPFAGAEILLLAVGFYLCALDGRETEVIRIKNDRIAIEKGQERTRTVWELDRRWARIELLPARIEWYPSRLVIRSHGKQLQLGAFLTEGERERLARELKRAISSEETFSTVAP
jgi:uncharacterized membrane protein